MPESADVRVPNYLMLMKKLPFLDILEMQNNREQIFILLQLTKHQFRQSRGILQQQNCKAITDCKPIESEYVFRIVARRRSSPQILQIS
ncbi:hypothetical protein Nepgr_028090 [Nepenthes gracilis]|uniref:Uncharacterized protein n=1 Tax=Nepenthes gracilis TaxID=150966 RepID=A0AAD3Y1T2_NEPGR|nr:hypothetical protein Nepgr_028090 [Nepenthes gracilis]